MMAYKAISIKCTKAIKSYHARRETNLTRLKSKNFYKFLNNRLKSRSSLPVMHNDNNGIFTSDSDKANAFIKEFEKVFTTDDGRRPYIDDVGIVCNDESIDFSVNTVYKHLLNINSSSAAGPDGLPGIFWHSLAGALAEPLSIIFTTSFTRSSIPLMWKESIISPIHKKGDPSNVMNYRPVALTCIPCRVMEAIIRDVVMSHLNENDLLTEYQHGFRKQHSTGLQLLQCFNDWTAAIDQGYCVDICYIDFAKAFDTVSIPKLLLKMSAYGIKNQLLSWMTEFLSDRIMRVKVNNRYSNAVTQTSGIAQGTCFGPLCFSLFVNDLPLQISNSKCEMFADDVKVYKIFSTPCETFNLQDDLNSICEWANTWQLQISIPKTFIVHLGYLNPCHDYRLSDNVIVSKCEVKDLGINISNDLSWHSQCIEYARKANSVANAILHCFECTDINVYMKAFDTYVRPIVEFNCYVWNPVLKMDIALIENVQKCFTRRAFYKCGLPRITYSERLLFLERESLEKRRMILSMCVFYDIYYGHVHCNILDNFRVPVLSLRGNDCRLFMPFCKTNIRKIFFSFRILHVWNSLPNVIVTSNVKTAFKQRIQEYLNV